MAQGLLMGAGLLYIGHRLGLARFYRLAFLSALVGVLASLGGLGDAPDLTGYGSRQWLVGIIRDPADKRFYGDANDRMPAYAETPEDPARNRLTDREVGLLADWLRGDWTRPND